MAKTETLSSAPMKADMEREKTVVLLGKESLLGLAVEFLFSPEKNWKVERVSDELGFEGIFQDIKKREPSIVILYQSGHPCDMQLLIRLLNECQDLKVITVSLENNFIQIYNKQSFWLKNANDLLALAEDDLQTNKLS